VVALLALSGCGGAADAPADRAVDDATGSAIGARENERIVVDFIEAWSRLDPVELAGFFAEDGVYHNMPSTPVQGRANVEALIRGFTAGWTETTWDIVRIMSFGDVVVAERVDRTRAGDKAVDLPVVGVFEMEGGKIKVWRDYFDLATYTRGLS